MTVIGDRCGPGTLYLRHLILEYGYIWMARLIVVRRLVRNDTNITSLKTLRMNLCVILCSLKNLLRMSCRRFIQREFNDDAQVIARCRLNDGLMNSRSLPVS
jgi:hypothetical protein